MSGKIEFREKLAGILEMAEGQENTLLLEEVEKYFEEDCLSAEQIELVCDYLLSQKVAVSGYRKAKGMVTEKDNSDRQSLSPQEQAYMAEYLESLSTAGMEDNNLKGYLIKTAELARQLYNPEIFIGDLIQEGNVSLIAALEKYRGKDAGEQRIMDEVRQGMQIMLESQTETRRRDKKMVQQAAQLDEKIKNLTEEMGRKVSVDEVAEQMGMSEEQVLDVLKLMGEEVPNEEAET